MCKLVSLMDFYSMLEQHSQPTLTAWIKELCVFRRNLSPLLSQNDCGPLHATVVVPERNRYQNIGTIVTGKCSVTV